MESANSGIDDVLNTVQYGDRETQKAVYTLYRQSAREAEKQIAAWTEVKATKLTKLNAALRQAGLPAISTSEIEEEVQELKSH
jgi:hypothetical protein